MFSRDLNKYLSGAEKTEDENKKNFFIVHCVNFSDIFCSYYNLAVNKYIPKKYFQQSLWWQVKFLRKLLILLQKMSPTSKNS